MSYGTKLECINSKEAAYVLGLFYADGCLSGGRIALKESDIEILNKVSLYIGCNPPRYIKPQVNRYSDSGQYYIAMGRESVNIASHIGSYKEFWPDLPLHLYSHFIRGVFDGDGCISLDSRYIQKYPGKAIPGDFFILFNYLEHAKIAQKIICERTHVNYTKVVEKTGQGSVPVYKIRWGGSNNLIKIRDWLYQDADLYISRKKELFGQIKVGDSKAAAKAGGLAMAYKRRQAYITWYCRACNKEMNTSKSRIKIYCSHICSNRRHLLNSRPRE